MSSIDRDLDEAQAQTEPDKAKGRFSLTKVMWVFVAAIVLVSIVLLIVYGDDINVEMILRVTPENLLIAALVFMGLFALKGLTMVFDMKLLFIAAGMLFPLPTALLVNILGTALEATIPYLEGKFGGNNFLQRLLKKWPKLEKVRTLRVKNSYLYAMLLRALGVMADPISMYLGASGTPYIPTILGSVTGMLPLIVITTVMGESIRQPDSPTFILSTALFVFFEVAAFSAMAIWLRRSEKPKDNHPSGR